MKVSGTTINEPRIIRSLLGRMVDWVRVDDDRRVVIIAGGGPTRGRDLLANGSVEGGVKHQRSQRVEWLADWAGMASTNENALHAQRGLEMICPQLGVVSMTNFGHFVITQPSKRVLLPYSDSALREQLRLGARIVVLGGGTGEPGVTTDSAMVPVARDLCAGSGDITVHSLLIKFTHSVSGVNGPDDVFWPRVSFGQFLEWAEGPMKSSLPNLFDPDGIRQIRDKGFSLFIGLAQSPSSIDDVLGGRAMGTLLCAP